MSNSKFKANQPSKTGTGGIGRGTLYDEIYVSARQTRRVGESAVQSVLPDFFPIEQLSLCAADQVVNLVKFLDDRECCVCNRD